MSKLSRLTALLLALWSPAALTCDLDDCNLSEALHNEAEEAAPEDSWSWVNHDLAVARDALKAGDHARTIALVRDLDGILRTNLKGILTVRGESRVRALHTALQDLSVSAGGWPLAELVVVPAGAKG